MNIITVNSANIDKEHICCAISEKKGETCVSSKKNWMLERFKNGLVFKKLNERGKVFIEYIPAEFAFAPITAPNFMYINCLWVSGKFKGKGYSNSLLFECIKDAKSKNKDGLVILSSKKKMHFLSDPSYLKHKGFKVCDTALPSFELLYLQFNKKSVIPKFNNCAKSGKTNHSGIVIYYSNQCPHTDKYVPIIENMAKSLNIDFKSIKIDTLEKAKKSPTPFTTYSLFVNHNFICTEVLTEKKFNKIMTDTKIIAI